MCKGYAALYGSKDIEFSAAATRSKRSLGDEDPTNLDVPTTVPRNSGELDSFEFLTGKTMAKPKDEGPEEPEIIVDPKKESQATLSPSTEPPTTTTTTAPPPTTLPDDLFWRRRPATRPPLPDLFSTSAFDIDFKITQDMSPSCRLLVYYIRERETVADSKVIDIEDSFANKVSCPAVMPIG